MSFTYAALTTLNIHNEEYFLKKIGYSSLLVSQIHGTLHL